MDVALIAGVATAMVIPFVQTARRYWPPVAEFNELVERNDWRAASRLARGACRWLLFARLCGGQRWYRWRSRELMQWQERAGAAAAAKRRER